MAAATKQFTAGWGSRAARTPAKALLFVEFEHHRRPVIASNSRYYVSDLFERRSKHELFDVDDSDRIGRLWPDAGQNERAMVGVHSDIEADDEA